MSITLASILLHGPFSQLCLDVSCIYEFSCYNNEPELWLQFLYQHKQCFILQCAVTICESKIVTSLTKVLKRVRICIPEQILYFSAQTSAINVTDSSSCIPSLKTEHPQSLILLEKEVLAHILFIYNGLMVFVIPLLVKGSYIAKSKIT